MHINHLRIQLKYILSNPEGLYSKLLDDTNATNGDRLHYQEVISRNSKGVIKYQFLNVGTGSEKVGDWLMKISSGQYMGITLAKQRKICM